MWNAQDSIAHGGKSLPYVRESVGPRVLPPKRATPRNGACSARKAVLRSIDRRPESNPRKAARRLWYLPTYLDRVSSSEAHEVRAAFSSAPLRRSRPPSGQSPRPSVQCVQHGYRAVRGGHRQAIWSDCLSDLASARTERRRESRSVFGLAESAVANSASRRALRVVDPERAKVSLRNPERSHLRNTNRAAAIGNQLDGAVDEVASVV